MGMTHWAREHVPELTAVLSLVAISLVVGAVTGTIPAAIFPSAPDWVLAAIPHANALVSLTAIAVIAVGVRSIRNGMIDRHRQAMLVALGLFATFLLMYLYRVAIHGPSPFEGPDVVYTLVYIPVLIVHMVLAVVCIPLLLYVLLLALTRPVSALPDTPHPRVGRVAATLWVTSFALGIVVYGLLYWAY